MLWQDPRLLEKLEVDLVDLANLRHLGTAAEAFLSRLDMLKPSRAVSTTGWALENRVFKGRNELETRWRIDLTPYVPGIQDACDEAGVRVVAVKGNTRSGKTVAAENHACKRWVHGPWGDMFWYMQSDDDVQDYMEERGEWMLEHHPQIAEKVDHTYKRQARDRKKIGESLARWMPATKKTTRGKGAPFIVADEIDGYNTAIMKGILTLLQNRQREFGSAALLYLSSHPDKGPLFGIESIIAKGLRHLWHWNCLHCSQPSSPAEEAVTRMNWNLGALMEETDGAETVDRLDYIRRHARLVCPHCQGEIDNEERLVMSRESGAWLQPGQKLVGPKLVEGPRAIDEVMGFVIHAFMAPFVSIGGLAGEFAKAQITYNATRDDEDLKEVTVKSLGEVYRGAVASDRIDDWKIVKRRMLNGPAYVAGTVPDGVDVLVAFVDNQKDYFAVRVFGYSAITKECWIIDCFEIEQWPADEESGRSAFQKIDPIHTLADWEILEQSVLRQSYPLASDPEYHMPIAKVAIDVGGGGDRDDTGSKHSATSNARHWAAQAIAEGRAEEWQLMLHRGSAHKTTETYGIVKQVMKDDRGKPLATGVWERSSNVNRVKEIIARRMGIDRPGQPGKISAPADLADKYFIEATAEQKINGEWIPSGRNETWDGLVAGDVARETLQMETIAEKWPEDRRSRKRPSWARAFRPGVDAGIDKKPRTLVSAYSRLVRFNRGEAGTNGQVQ